MILSHAHVGLFIITHLTLHTLDTIRSLPARIVIEYVLIVALLLWLENRNP